MVRPDLGALTDEALFRGFIHGDYQAFEVLVQRYRRGIYGFLLRSTRDKEAAEDLYQEVFLRVVKKAKDFLLTHLGIHMEVNIATIILILIMQVMR